MDETYHLICNKYAQELQARKPPKEELALIEPGAWIKIWDNDEFFFVRVTEINGNMIKGIVDNDLVKPHEFKCDDIIEVDLPSVLQVVPKRK